MNLGYKPLIELEIFHEYYMSGITQDFICEPTVNCLKILNGHHIIYRTKPNGFGLFNSFEENKKLSFINFKKGTRLLFVMKLKNNNVLNVTNISRNNGDIIYFTNESEYEVLSQNSLKLRPELFNYSFYKKGVNKIQLQIKNLTNDELLRLSVNGKQGIFETEIDFRQHSPGIYEFILFHNNKIIQKERICINGQLFADQPFGLIELQNFNTDRSLEYFKVSLTTKSVPWTYHLNLKKSYPEYTFKIEKQDQKIENNRYADFPFYFEKKTPKSEEKSNTIIFQSMKYINPNKSIPSKIPFYEEPTQLQLVQYKKSKYRYDRSNYTYNKRRKHKYDEEEECEDNEHTPAKRRRVVIKKLPKPTTNNLNSEVFIYI